VRSAILFSFGAEGYRYMDPDATVMIHDVSSMDVWERWKRLKLPPRKPSDLNQKIYTMMAENCGHHKDYFLDIMYMKKATPIGF
jgi:ATP-dependent protease ClpP protease subunit